MQAPKLTLPRRRLLSILTITILVASTFIAAQFILTDLCHVEIWLKDSKGKPIRGAIVTIWTWYPGEKSRVIKVARSDDTGLIEFWTSWRGLLGPWIQRAERGLREEVGLIIDIYDPANKTVATKTIMINTAERSPVAIGGVLIVNSMTKIHAGYVKNSNQGAKLATYTPIVEETYEHRGRINLASVKTDSNTEAIIHYVAVEGAKTRARLVIGYEHSNYTVISEPIYSRVHSENVGKTANVPFSSTGWISIIMTTRFEVVGYYWRDKDGNLHLMYRELRLWAYDFNVSSLSSEKGEEPVWGLYGEKLMKTARGKGFSALDEVITLWGFEFYSGDSRTIDLPLPITVYNALSKIIAKYGFSSTLLSSATIAIDHAAAVLLKICGAKDYYISAYGRYSPAHRVYFLAVDIISVSTPPSSSGSVPYPIISASSSHSYPLFLRV